MTASLSWSTAVYLLGLGQAGVDVFLHAYHRVVHGQLADDNLRQAVVVESNITRLYG